LSTPVLEIKGLRTYFNTPAGVARAVDGISLTIERGETFALVGESGCGKSVTALSAIQLIPAPAGYIADGEILLNNENIVTLSEREKRSLRGNKVSMIFQEPMTSLNPVFTIGSQIIETIKLHQGKSKGEAKALAIEMLARVGLPEPAKIYDDYPHSLSGGMRQRVMIAIALSCRPDLLIADEPTTALDVTIQAQILELTRELQRELGTAILLITHNMALVYRNAKEVGVMYAGKIVEQASTKELFRDPMHPYTIQLLSAIPEKELRGTPLETIKGTVPPATDFPIGCRFAGRCPREMKGCAENEPPLTEYKEGHLTACFLYDKDFMEGSLSTVLAEEPEEITPIGVYAPEHPVLLSVKGLKKHFPIRKGLLKREVDRNRAVDGIDLAVHRGKTLALVGESGCGKTTAGKSIIQLIKPTAGEVIFDGVDIASLSESGLLKYRSKIQIIFQDPYSSLNPRMMVGEIIEEGLRSLCPELSKTERMKKINETLERVGLTANMKNRYPHEFSGGQRQRIGIARVLAVEPEFIICDEAVSALDVSVQAQILNLLKSIQKDFNISYLFITHDLGVVEYIADEVAVMHKGLIVERGTVDEIFTNPTEEYTKKLLGAVPRID
jgi:oligopeptide/dipeptide ABC transporter ATP-binding protein